MHLRPSPRTRNECSRTGISPRNVENVTTEYHRRDRREVEGKITNSRNGVNDRAGKEMVGAGRTEACRCSAEEETPAGSRVVGAGRHLGQ